jgi:sulfonate transport system substrate-binding protein
VVADFGQPIYFVMEKAPMKIVRLSLLLIAVSLGSLPFWACNRGKESQSASSHGASSSGPARAFAIGTFSKAISLSPLYVAQHFRWFETDAQIGGHVTFREFNDRAAISAALTAGEIQLLFSAEIPAIICEAQGNDLELWAITGTSVQKVLVRSDSKIKSPTDLRGKRVAVLQSTSAHYGLLRILADAHLTESDVRIAYMPPAEARAAFESRQLDGWAIWAPFIEEQELRGTGREIGGEGVLIDVVMTVPVSTLHIQPDFGRAAAAIIRRAKEWILANPDQAQQIVATRMGLDIQVVRKAWPKFQFSPSVRPNFASDLQEKADFLSNADKTRASKRIDVRKDLIAPSILENAR